MRKRNWEDFVQFDKDGRLVRREMDSSLTQDAAPTGTLDDEVNDTFLTVGIPFFGASDATGDVDRYKVTLEAGKTYFISLEGAGASPLNDTYLELINPSFTAFVKTDDDGGNGLNSMITYTPTVTGDFYLRARAFDNGPSDPGVGTYSINIVPMTTDSVGNTNATSGILQIGGSVYGFRETGTDVDRYAVTLEAGKFYTFQVAGGADYATNLNAVPVGELDTILTLRDAAGNVIFQNDDNGSSDPSSGLGYSPTVSGTYYLDVNAYPGNTGGYQLISSQPITVADLADLDPLDSLRWVEADNIPAVDTDGNGTPDTAYVYFAAASEGGFGEVENTDDFPAGTPITTYGWTAEQQAGVMHALQNQYTPITGINYVVTTDLAQATFRLITTENDDYGARFYARDSSYGSLQGLGIFNRLSGGFGSDNDTLLPGGFSYATILHEFGHGHGIAHPHDQGGGSGVMVGVTGNGSLGVFNLNQGVYTVMSYNDGYITHPDGTRTYAVATRDNGWSETLSAFDIKVLQERHGVHEANTGNTVYTLASTQAEASYQTLWDTGGNDTIAYNGSANAQIDLLAATLDYSPTGGGVVSYAGGIFGGYTIANGVTIENATGGSGNDVLLGNSANNVLTGNAGDDKLAGRGGIDVYKLGAGADQVLAFLSDPIQAKRGALSYDIIADFDGIADKIDFSALDANANVSGDQAFKWIGTSANKNAGELSYKVYDSLNGAEKALGIEIDNYSGAHNGKVTVVFANLDGGATDYAMVLLGNPQLSADDFLM